MTRIALPVTPPVAPLVTPVATVTPVAVMLRLIDDLLDGSRVGAGEFRLQSSTLDLGRILAEAVDACRHAIDTKRQRLRVELAPGMARVDGDPQRLTQVFSNLLNNASRRTPAGGDIILAMVANDSEVAISVAHEGVGIAPEALPHIFDLFTLDTNMACCAVAGQGAGVAAALSVKSGRDFHEIDIAPVQRELERQGVRIY